MYLHKLVLTMFLITACYAFSCQAQDDEWLLVKSIQISGVNTLTRDGQKLLYIGTNSGDVVKFDLQGNELVRFSPVKNGAVHSIDAWSRFKVLVFYQNFQEFILLDRFLNDPARYHLNDFSISFANSIALNFQRNIWVLDQADISIRLFNPDNNEIVINQALNAIIEQPVLEISSMKEYQNKLYILDDLYGVYVLDNFGNLIDKIEEDSILYMTFDSNKLVLLKQKEIIIRDINSPSIQRIIPPPYGYNYMVKIGNTFCFANSSRLDIYNYISTR